MKPDKNGGMVIGVRIPEKLYYALKEFAEKENRSVHNSIVVILLRYFNL